MSPSERDGEEERERDRLCERQKPNCNEPNSWIWASPDPIPGREKERGRQGERQREMPAEACNLASWADGRLAAEAAAEWEGAGKHFLLIGFWPGRRLDCLQLRENLILNLLKKEKHRKNKNKNTRQPQPQKQPQSESSTWLASFSHKSKVGLLSYHNNYGTRT